LHVGLEDVEDLKATSMPASGGSRPSLTLTITQGCSDGFETPRQAGSGHGIDRRNRLCHRPRARQGARRGDRQRTHRESGEAVQRISSEVGSRAIGIAADLSSAEGAARLVAQAGRVDILVNNVGIFWPVPFLEISDQDWFHIFEVNVMSGVRLSREAFASNAEAQLGPHHFCLQ
jgi:hypothetical protein